MILVDKYIITCMINYEDEKQSFNLHLITRDEGVNDLYFGKFFKLNNGRFLIKKKDYFVSFEDYFDSKIIKTVGTSTKVINSFHFKTFQLRSTFGSPQRGTATSTPPSSTRSWK